MYLEAITMLNQKSLKKMEQKTFRFIINSLLYLTRQFIQVKQLKLITFLINEWYFCESIRYTIIIWFTSILLIFDTLLRYLLEDYKGRYVPRLISFQLPLKPTSGISSRNEMVFLALTSFPRPWIVIRCQRISWFCHDFAGFLPSSIRSFRKSENEIDSDARTTRILIYRFNTPQYILIFDQCAVIFSEIENLIYLISWKFVFPLIGTILIDLIMILICLIGFNKYLKHVSEEICTYISIIFNL